MSLVCLKCFPIVPKVKPKLLKIADKTPQGLSSATSHTLDHSWLTLAPWKATLMVVRTIERFQSDLCKDPVVHVLFWTLFSPTLQLLVNSSASFSLSSGHFHNVMTWIVPIPSKFTCWTHPGTSECDLIWKQSCCRCISYDEGMGSWSNRIGSLIKWKFGHRHTWGDNGKGKVMILQAKVHQRLPANNQELGRCMLRGNQPCTSISDS